MKVSPHPSGFIIKADYYSNALTVASRATPGMTWDKLAKGWAGPRDAVELCLRHPSLATLRIDKSSLSEKEEALSLDAWFAANTPRKHTLRQYQREGVEFLVREAPKGAILADTMSLGKTGTTLTAARYFGGRTVVCCPNHVLGVWRSEVEEWWPEAGADKTYFPKGVKAPEQIPEWARLIVLNYDVLYAWVDALISAKPVTMVWDECHALGNAESRRHKSARRLRASVPNVIALSGTPLTNRPSDLYPILESLRPGSFGSFFAYGRRYCDARQEMVTPTKMVWKFDGATHLDELNTRLRASLMLRRTTQDVAIELPAKSRQVIFVDVPSKARISPEALTGAAIRTALDKAADAKMSDVEALILSHLADGLKVVAFTYRKHVADGLAECAVDAGFPASVMHGDISMAKREEAIEAARSAEGAYLLTATIDSSGSGIDLSFGDVGVYAELSPEPYKLLQSEMRLPRFGRTKPVLFQYVIARGTTDELIAQMVISKLDNFEKAIGTTNETLATDLQESEADIMGALYGAITAMQAK